LDWDAATYHSVASPQERWAREIIARVHLRGDEAILDAGCGTGRVTQLLLELIPQGHLVAVDASERMVAAAREHLGDRAEVLHQNLLELHLQQPVDVIFSCAVFHHIHDHETLFARCFAALQPGGRIVAQCGGLSNVAQFRARADEVAAREPYVEHLRDMPAPWNYASPQDTEQRLRDAGYDEVRCWLEPRATPIDDPPAYLSSVLCNYHLDRLPAELHEPFVADVARQAGDPLVVDYVRLNIDARRPPTGNDADTVQRP
jgi:trans-aconitate 2-methyltransferase